MGINLHSAILIFAAIVLGLLSCGNPYDQWAAPNPNHCSNDPSICSSTQQCDTQTGRCVDAPNSSIAVLTVAGGTLSPDFLPTVTMYTLKVPYSATAVQLAAMAVNPAARITVNGTAVGMGRGSTQVALTAGVTTILVAVQEPAGATTAYTLIVTRSKGSDYFKASNTDAGDQFGISVALEGDTLVVGANLEGSNATGIDGDQTNNDALSSGAVYVFQRTGNTWVQQAYLKASNTNAGDNFGFSVSLSGNTLAVGAYYEASNAPGVNGDQTNNSLSKSGAVYVFQRTGITWAQQAYLKASNPGASDRFGWSVLTKGDTLVVGAIYESSSSAGVDGDQTNNSAPYSGAVYVFQRNGITWTQQAYLKAANPGTDDRFGWSLALDGSTLVIGAVYENSNATGINGDQTSNSAGLSGAVYVFQRTATSWIQTDFIKASNTGVGDRFGWSVALQGDTLAVGAIYESSKATGINGDQTNSGASLSGAVYVFQRTGTTWAQTDYLKTANTDPGDRFGWIVSLSGDTLAVVGINEGSNATGINGDQTNNNASISGAVYVFQRTATTWAQQDYLKASNTDANDKFGYGMALSGGTLAVGALQESSNGTGINGTQTNNSAQNSGAVYVFPSIP